MAEPIEALKERIRDANDIVDVIGGYVKIIRAGGSYKALCPFHQEKTPSFHINPQRQSYHCFGCGAGGDVFSFVMQRESVDFMAAMELLADRAGIAFEIGRGPQADRSGRDLLYRIHDELTQFYQRVLNDAVHGAAARHYLDSRGFAADTIAEFKIGFAPDANSLVGWAGKRGFERADLLRAGVLVEGEGQLYDRFRGRNPG